MSWRWDFLFLMTSLIFFAAAQAYGKRAEIVERIGALEGGEFADERSLNYSVLLMGMGSLFALLFLFRLFWRLRNWHRGKEASSLLAKDGKN